jgi:hypothetical protein
MDLKIFKEIKNLRRRRLDGDDGQSRNLKESISEQLKSGRNIKQRVNSDDSFRCRGGNALE